MRIDPKADTSGTVSINTGVSIHTILARRSLLFKKKEKKKKRPCEPTYWIHGKHITRGEIRESQKVKCRSRKEEAVYTYAVKILQQWLLEPVTHEIWEAAALSTIYSTAREKEKRWRKQPHHIHSGAESFFFFSLIKTEFCNAIIVTVVPQKVVQFLKRTRPIRR